MEATDGQIIDLQPFLDQRNIRKPEMEFFKVSSHLDKRVEVVTFDFVLKKL